MAAASKAYSWELTEEQRQECRAAAAKLRTRPRLEQSGVLTGQQYFVRGKCAKVRARGMAAGASRKAK